MDYAELDDIVALNPQCCLKTSRGLLADQSEARVQFVSKYRMRSSSSVFLINSEPIVKRQIKFYKNEGLRHNLDREALDKL